MVVKKPHYGKCNKRVEESHAARRLFQPVRSSSQQNPLTVDELVSELYPDCSTAVAFKYAMPDLLPQNDPSGCRWCDFFVYAPAGHYNHVK